MLFENLLPYVSLQTQVSDVTLKINGQTGG